jgi:hypothetical protein
MMAKHRIARALDGLHYRVYGRHRRGECHILSDETRLSLCCTEIRLRARACEDFREPPPYRPICKLCEAAQAQSERQGEPLNRHVSKQHRKVAA